MSSSPIPIPIPIHPLLLLLFLSLALIFSSSSALVSPTAFVTSPTGIRIPLSLIRSRFPSSSSVVSSTSARAVLYDVDPITHVLHFPLSVHSVDLKAVTSVVTHDLLTSKGHEHDAVIRTGNGFSVVHTNEGHVLSVSMHAVHDNDEGIGRLYRTGIHLDLTPLDSDKYPSVFINLGTPVTKRQQEQIIMSIESDHEHDRRQERNDVQRLQRNDDLGSVTITSSSSVLTDKESGSMPSSITPTQSSQRETMGAVDSNNVEQPLLPPHRDLIDLSLSTRHTQSSSSSSSSSFSSSLTSLSPTLRNRSPKPPCHLGLSIRRLRIAVASDLTFCSGHGHNAKRARAAIQAKFQLMIQPYLTQTCIFPTLSHIELHCSKSAPDPYAPLRLQHRHNASRTLEQFQRLWNAKRSSIKRDVAFYYPGYVDATDFSGVAYIGRLCNRKWAYGWAEGLSPLVMAHELGHLLNCDHARDGGIMSPYQYQTAAAVPGVGGGRAYGSKHKTGLSFSTSSLKQLYAYVDTKASSCLAVHKQASITKRNCVTGLSATSGKIKSASQSFSCSKRLAGYVYNKAMPLDRVTVYLTQEFDHMKVSFVTSGGARIRQLATRFGMYKVAFRSDLRRAQTFSGNGRTNVEFKLKLNKIAPPFSEGSCCGKDLAMVFSIRFCNAVQKSQCADGFHGFWRQVGCVTCPRGRKLMKQGPHVKCATCV